MVASREGAPQRRTTGKGRRGERRFDPHQGPEMLAAVDLGSNSFRMVIARVIDEQLQLIDRLREGVQLAASLDAEQKLDAAGQARALACLSQFGQRLRDFAPAAVRAVGTNTLRKAKNRDAFLRRAEEALGHPIEVVSGQEEARLIYLGAAHSLPSSAHNRLVVDIGGGSTECIIGCGFEPQLTESLYMGCVAYTQEFFPQGKLKSKAMRQAETAAQLELQPLRKAFRQLGWQSCVGASGTILAISQILRVNGWGETAITVEGLQKLRHALLRTERVDQLQIPGLRKDRARVLPGGLAILLALFDQLGIEQMSVSSGALREGVLYDLLGRIRHEDVRDRTIRRFVELYRVDLEQAARVEQTALAGLEQVGSWWDLEGERGRPFLSWSARLHEIGLTVAHSGFHKHGAYLLANSNLPGFSLQDQRLLSLLVRAHRRKFLPTLFAGLPKAQRKSAMALSILLRLAVLLNRSRSRDLVPFRLEGSKQGLHLAFPPGWLDAHPLTGADLAQEAVWLRPVLALEVAVDQASPGPG